MRILTLCTFSLLLVSCGIQGDLYLPDRQPEPQPVREAPPLQERDDLFEGRY